MDNLINEDRIILVYQVDKSDEIAGFVAFSNVANRNDCCVLHHSFC